MLCLSVHRSVGLSKKCKSLIFQHFTANNCCFHIGKLIVGKFSPNANPNLAKLALILDNPVTHPPTNLPNEGARIQFIFMEATMYIYFRTLLERGWGGAKNPLLGQTPFLLVGREELYQDKPDYILF